MNNILNQIIEETAKENNLSCDLVRNIYWSYWKFIKSRIAEFDLLNASEDDFKRFTTNFNIPYIGKLYTSIDNINKVKNKFKYYNTHVKNKKTQTNI